QARYSFNGSSYLLIREAPLYRNISSTGGALTFSTASSFTDNGFHLQFADFDLDSKNDLFFQNTIRQNNATGPVIDATTFGAAFSVGTAYFQESPFGIGDINGDGTPDICKFDRIDALVELIPNIHSGGILSTTSFGSTSAFSTYGGGPLSITCN